MVGTVTGGGAHTVEPREIDENFEISIPTGRAINPIIGSNWEGVGVRPHVDVDEVEALDEAYLMALEESLRRARSSAQKEKLRSLINAIQNQN